MGRRNGWRLSRQRLPIPNFSFKEDEWRLQAKCHDTDVNQFFPVIVGKRKGRNIMSVQTIVQVENTINQFCRQCPVRLECLEWGIRSHSEGIFGGKLLFRYATRPSNGQRLYMKLKREIELEQRKLA
jgi:Transcription factor WhiB